MCAPCGPSQRAGGQTISSWLPLTIFFILPLSCSGCKFAGSAVCSPDSVDVTAAQCCDSTGQYRTFGLGCTDKLGSTGGYCGAGVCNSHHAQCASQKLTAGAYKNTDDVCVLEAGGGNVTVTTWITGSYDCQIGCAWPADFTAEERGTCRKPLNSTPMGASSISPAHQRVRPLWARSTCR